ncbi:preprotein translocase subunit YajC, partial [Umezakia ovalisporum]
MMDFILLMGGPQGGGGSIQLVFLGLMSVVFWFFMIRPQAKKAKEQKSI